jgi:mono/diheme cytochrome c family protein
MHKKRWFIGFISLSALTLTVLGLNRVQGQNDVVKRGKYLVDTIGACGQCHTPRKGAEPDMSMYLAGHPANAPYPKYDFKTMMGQGIFMVTAQTMTAFAAPFGTTFATNLTPDKETGLGEWTEQMFIGAMRTGRHQGVESNRKIFPPMPAKNYSEMSEEDLKAIWAYLKTVNAVKNDVPPALNPRGRPW